MRAMIGAMPARPTTNTTTNTTTKDATTTGVACRPGCAACCTAPSISSAIPGMPGGKPAGVPCVQLDPGGRCRLFGRPERPAVCSSLQPSIDMCGSDRGHAMHWLARLEAATAPSVR